METFKLKASLILVAILLFADCLNVEGQICRPSGTIRGKKPPPGKCNQDNDSGCCKEGQLYTKYKCSPPVSSHTKAYLTLNGFEKDEDGGAPSECDNHYHSDDTPVVALSIGWYNKGSRCLNNITITANGRSVEKVAHYWNGGYTIGMVATLLKRWLTIGIVAILLEW